MIMDEKGVSENDAICQSQKKKKKEKKIAAICLRKKNTNLLLQAFEGFPISISLVQAISQMFFRKKGILHMLGSRHKDRKKK